MKLLKLFARKPKRVTAFPDQKHIIKEAFIINGVQYYHFDDVFALPYERGLKAITYYEEARMKCSLEYLLLHTQAIDSILKNKTGTIRVFDIEKLNSQLKERLTFANDTDLLYKLASIIFFDQTENPSTYEYKYNIDTKIPFWKEHSEVGSFFLQEPVVNLIPFLKQSEPISQSYVEVLERVNRLHMESVQSHISRAENSTPSGSGV